MPYEINHVVQHDISAVRREYAFRVSWLEKLLAGHLYDQRDLVVLRLLLNVLVVSLPSALGVFLFHSHLLGLCHLILNYALLLQRFLVALLHVTEHRRLFRSGKLCKKFLQLVWPLSPLAQLHADPRPAVASFVLNKSGCSPDSGSPFRHTKWTIQASPQGHAPRGVFSVLAAMPTSADFL